MLKKERATDYVAHCESCDEVSPPFVGSKELAVLRLMRLRWRVRTESGETHTWCPSCHTAPSIPPFRAER
jgi:hypothetical protein